MSWTPHLRQLQASISYWLVTQLAAASNFVQPVMHAWRVCICTRSTSSFQARWAALHCNVH